MPRNPRIDQRSLARRVAQELLSREAVGLGPGLPSTVAAEVPEHSGVRLLSGSGALGYRALRAEEMDYSRGSAAKDGPVDSNGQPVAFLPGGAAVSTVDSAAMFRGGHIATAILQPVQVTASGDFTHWSTAAVPGLFPPGSAVEWAAGAGRVIAMMSHTDSSNAPNIVDRLSFPVDGLGRVSLIVTDVAVIRVIENRLVLVELAPGWTADDVAAITGPPLTLAAGLKEMTFDTPALTPPGKVYPTGLAAVQDLPDGALVNIDGFGGPGGMAHYLLVALRDRGATSLTIISNTAGIARVAGFGTPPGREAIDHTILMEANRVKKVIASYPVSPSASRPNAFELAFQRGEVELEVVPQGTLAERLRAGGAGVTAFFTPTAAGTLLSQGKETRFIDGKEHVLEMGLMADFALMRAHKADTLGNLVYKATSRNFNMVMATAARVTVAEVDEIVEPGELDPEEIVTPGVYVHRIVKRPAGFSPYE